VFFVSEHDMILSMNKAIYKPVATDAQVEAKSTLVYDRSGGFTWFRAAGKDGNLKHGWHGYFSSAPEAETACRKAGFDPEQIYYTS